MAEEFCQPSLDLQCLDCGDCDLTVWLILVGHHDLTRALGINSAIRSAGCSISSFPVGDNEDAGGGLLLQISSIRARNFDGLPP